ncbi:sodium/calcium exchanger regulatory protein 1-like [Dreissena polymorpha]|uniref:Cytosolic fatty-acid binding proteins domain-containing protein n=1 Tax=Dreissena polymorpha TaxID=45954 RepID=A0A9D4N6F4_DREPO|nr:sodium/calcium exchanger regulatory protein 1-like [Dreissena polymorpha]KAH3887577.1 hypothetical protein DPMN_011595 [Dreissena polymorpha]
MASAIGKWKIEHSVNFEEYMKAIGVSDEKRLDAHKFLSDGSNMTQEISDNGGSWSIKTTTAAGEKTITFKLGEELDTMTLDGRNIKVLFSADGDKLVENQTGNGFQCKHVRHGDGNTLTMILTGGGQTCIRTYVKC